MGLKKFIRKFGGPLGSVVAAGASLIGGSRSNKANRASANQEYERQKEFAQMGIRWKVEDAKAAGLHPLFALGAQTPSYNPVSVQDSMGPALSEAGQNIGAVIARTATHREREVASLQLKALQNSVVEGDLRNEGLRLQNRQLENDLLLAPVVMPQFDRPNIDEALGVDTHDADKRLKDAVIYSSEPGDPSVAVGETPIWRQFSLGRGQRIVLPGGMQGDAAEVLESLGESPVLLAWVYKENVKRFGKEFTDGIWRQFGFRTPSENKQSIRRGVSRMFAPTAGKNQEYFYRGPMD